MTPEERRAELRRKAGLPPEGEALPPVTAAPDLNLQNLPPDQGGRDSRHAELRAKVGLDAPSQQRNPDLRNYRVPERIMGIPMPYSSGETDYLTNEGAGYGIEMPKHAPDAVKRAIAKGVQDGDRTYRRGQLLADAGRQFAAPFRTGNLGAYSPNPWPDVNSGQDSAPRRGRDIPAERLGAAATGLLDLPSLGFSDEIIGLAGGPEAAARQKELIDSAYEMHPVSTLIGGGPALAMPFQSVRGASTLAKMGSASLRGGASSAIYGYGSGDGGPLSADRLTQGGVYGVAGGTLSAAFPLGARGVEFLARKMPGSAQLRSLTDRLIRGDDSAFSAAEVSAIDEAITQMQKTSAINGRSIDRNTARAELTQALRMARENDFVFETLGEGGVYAAQGSAQPGMAGAEAISSALSERGVNQYSRINQVVGRIAGGEDIESSLAAVAKTKSEEASPLYEQAYKVPVNTASEGFQALQSTLALPQFKTGRARGESIWRLRENRPDGKFEELPFFKQIQFIKEGVDDQIARLLRSGDNQQAAALIARKNEMLGIVDQMNPAYAQARSVWAGAEAQKNALLLGESVFRANNSTPTGTRWREIKAAYDRMSEAERTAFSVGLFERAVEAAGERVATATGQSVPNKFLAPGVEARVRQVLPEEQADEFFSLVQREYSQQANANFVLPRSGSKTGSVNNASEAVRAGTVGAMRRGAGAILGGKRTIENMAGRARARIENNSRAQERLANFLITPANDPTLTRGFLGRNQNALAAPPPAAPAGGTPPPSPMTEALSQPRPNPYMGRKSFRGAEEARGPRPDTPDDPVTSGGGFKLFGRGQPADLPMDEASRMARAQEMGFDTDTKLYHGTNAKFDAFDNARIGSSTDEGYIGRGHYFSNESPGEARYYGDNVGEYYGRGKILDVGQDGGGSWPEMFKQWAGKMEEIGALGKKYTPALESVRKIDKLIDDSVEVMPLRGPNGEDFGFMARIPDPSRPPDVFKGKTYVNYIETRPPVREHLAHKTKEEAVDALRHRAYYELRGADGFDGLDNIDTFSDAVRTHYGSRTITDAAKQAGYDGIKEGSETVIFDPKNIRRTDARFDPAKSDSPILTDGARADIAGLLTGGAFLSAAGSIGGEESPVGRGMAALGKAGNAMTNALSNVSLPDRPIDRMRGPQHQANSSYIPQNALNAARQDGQNLAAQAMLARRQQLAAGPQPDNALAPNRVAEMQQGLQQAVESGQMTIEEAAAEMDKHLARAGLPRSQNPFRVRQAG